MSQKLNIWKRLVETKSKNRKSWKKELAAAARQRLAPSKKTKIPRTLLEVFRDITAHLIHDKNTSIAVPCTGFNVSSAGYNPRWIYWKYEFLFVRPRGLRTWRPAQTGPGGQNRAFKRFDPMILCSFLWRFRWTTLESHNSKLMMVYEQINFL